MFRALERTRERNGKNDTNRGDGSEPPLKRDGRDDDDFKSADQGAGGVGEGKDTDGGEVEVEVSVGESEDDGGADGKEEFAEGETFDFVEDLPEWRFCATDKEEGRNGEGGEEIDVPICGEEPREGEANEAHPEVDGLAADFRGEGELVDEHKEECECQDDEEDV